MFLPPRKNNSLLTSDYSEVKIEILSDGAGSSKRLDDDKYEVKP